MATIVIVEDEPDLQAVLDYNLRQAGHEVLVAARGSDGLALCRQRHPALLILDLMLPDMPGTEVCKALRTDPEGRSLPILILTAKQEEIDRVLGFELGADDYMTKPFSMRELLLRVQAILRRTAAPEAPAGELVRFGRLRIDKAAHRVFVGEIEVELTALEFKLLVMLHERRNRVQSRETLLEDVWGLDPSISSRTVDTHIKRLREKLGEAAQYIETVRGAGYRFAASPEA
jgi:two-component system, OmpR family, phosphate regulon response regulator PhoB